MVKKVLYLGLDPSHYLSNKEVIHWPIIQIVPRPLSETALYQSLIKFKHYSHVIVTSKTTVFILQNYLTQLGIDLEIWKNKKTLAVGKITAKHLQAYGILPLKNCSRRNS